MTTGLSPDWLLAVLWMAWFAGWYLAAPFTARTVARQPILSRLAHTLLICAGSAAIVRHPPAAGMLPRPLLARLDEVAWGGVLVAGAGLGYTVWARAHLGRFWSGSVTLKADHVLVRTGPYALTRHPIYTGLLLALAGTVLARGTILDLAGFVLVAAGVMLKIHQEERLLTQHFGAEYRAYQSEVPALVPCSRRK
jgi:protein-S-isoprenylcysteine O-methyltransferase Ste14